MKILKSVVIAFSLAVGLGAVSTAAIAKPIDQVNTVQEKITAAEAAINNGTDGSDVAILIKSASDAAETINANDKVSRETSKASKHLKAAIASAKAANLQESKEHLAKAKEVIEGLKKIL